MSKGNIVYSNMDITRNNISVHFGCTLKIINCNMVNVTVELVSEYGACSHMHLDGTSITLEVTND